MEDDPLSQLQLPPALPARVLNVLLRIWTRASSPAGVRLLAPALAVVAVYVLWHVWRAAGRSALGRALRWHTVFALAAVIAGIVLSLLAAPPEDPTEAAAVLAAEGVGRDFYPGSVVLAGASLVALSTLAALHTLWRTRVPLLDRMHIAVQWRNWRLWYGPRTLAVTAALVGGVATLGSAAFAAGTLSSSALPERSFGGGALWVGTPAGAARLTEAGWHTLRRPSAPLPADTVLDVAGGTDGSVWLATNGGLLRIAPDGSYMRAIVENAPLPYPTVLGVAVDRRGGAWAATAAGGAGVDTTLNGRAFTGRTAPLLHSLLDAVLVDRRGLVWFGGAGGVNVYEPAPDWSLPGRWPAGFNQQSSNGGLPGSLVYAIYEDRMGRVWFGTLGGAAALAPDPAAFALGSTESARWITFTAASSGLANDRVHAIAEDLSGRIYFGTEHGVSIYEDTPAGGRWSAIGPDRLPHPHVEALAVTPDGRIWVGTRSGLAVYDPRATAPQLPVYRSHPIRRWTGLLWPPHSHQDLPADEVTSLAWIP